MIEIKTIIAQTEATAHVGVSSNSLDLVPPPPPPPPPAIMFSLCENVDTIIQRTFTELFT